MMRTTTNIGTVNSMVRFRRWLAWRLVRNEIRFVVENASDLGVTKSHSAKVKESVVCDAIELIFQH